MQIWRAIPSFYCLSSQWSEDWIWVCSRLVSCWFRVLIGHRVSIISMVEWHKSCWNHVPYIVRVQKYIRFMLLINKTVMLIVTGNALGFFTGSGNVIPFSVDLSDFCRSFRVESNTTIKIFIGHDVLLINEVHTVMERNSLFEILATIWYKIIFWTQKRMNCKLCGIIRTDLGFFVAANRFLQREKLFNFDKGENWILIVRRYWWETSLLVGYFVAGRKELLLLGTIFTEWFFRVASCCFYMVLTNSDLLYMDNLSFSGRSYNGFHICEVFIFFGDLVQVLKLFCFSSHLFRLISPDNLWLYQGTLFLLSKFLRHVVCAVNLRKHFSRAVCHHKRELVPLELFSQTSTFILIANFWMYIVRF